MRSGGIDGGGDVVSCGSTGRPQLSKAPAMPDIWTQNYDPAGFWPLSTLAAATPVLVLLGLLGSGRASAGRAALVGLITALAVAVGLFQMPGSMAVAAIGQGLIFAAFRIVWLVVAAVFLYDIVVATGQFDIMKASIARLSGDRRIQAVLVAFSFGAFLEGVAGFGAPVAITAAFLVGLGFAPHRAAILCLIANTAPVAWGSIGIPIRTLAGVTGLDVEALSATSGRILPPIALILPFWIVRSMVSWRETWAVWPALLVVGASFATTQFVWSNFVGFEVVDLASAVVSLGAGMILLRVWRPAVEWRFDHDGGEVEPQPVAPPATAGRVARAWLPFGLLTATVLVWGIPPVKKAMDDATTSRWPIPGLHNQVARGEPITGHPAPTPADREPAVADLVPISATGTAVFVAAVASGLILGLRPARLARLLAGTVRRLLPAIGAIGAMLALGFVTRSSGMDVVLGLAFTRTGATFYPVFGALLGWLGVALTGSDTAGNVLFGNLQRVTAEKLGLSPILMASANTTGGVMGKMIDAQSIVVAAAATGETGQEGKILRAVIGHSLALALIVGAIVWMYAHLLPGVVAVPLAK